MIKPLLLFCAVLFSLRSHAQDGWKFKTEDDGIRVYTRVVPNSNFKAVKVNCELNATLSQLVAVIMDIKNSTNWAYHTKSAVILKQYSPADLYYHCIVAVPWPVQNRDFICHLIVKQNAQTKVVTIDAPCPADYIPEKPGFVRVKQSVGKWILTPINGGSKVKVDYTLSLDPGGNIPAWVINLFAAEGPMHTFKGLKLQLNKPAYQHPEVPYITD